MRFFLKDIAILIAIFCSINILLFLFVTDNLLYKDYEQHTRILNSQSSSTSVIFGDSHGWALTNMNEDVKNLFTANSIYNMSYGSDSYADIYVKLQWLLANVPSVKRIIISADDHMLTKKSNNANRTMVYSTATLHASTYQVSSLKYYYYQVVKYMPMLYSSNQKLITKYFSSKVNDILTFDQNTKQAATNSFRAKADFLEARISAFFPDRNLKLRSTAKTNLKNILNIAQENKIEVVLIKFPLTKEMSDKIEQVGGSNLVSNHISEKKELQLFDYQLKFNNVSYFRDQDHVNKVGALELALQIIQDVDSITALN